MKKVLLLFVCVFTVGFLLAQRTVTGKVTDNKDEPLIGANVIVKGATGVGTVTDFNGEYSVEVPAGYTTIVFSYTGFETQEFQLGASNVMNVVLSEGVQLSEVVVTGLSIKREKKTLGYGVSTVSSEDIAKRTEGDVARLLRGKTTGVNIVQSSGTVGSGTNVIIRGYSSITGSNQPLWVVDGVPFNGDTNEDRGFVAGGATASSRFADLDPNNIAEISILKGLSATVLYGEAGRNGVILITTKTGAASGAPADKGFEVSVTQNVFFSEVANLPDYQDSYGNGFSGDFGWFFSNWGPSFDVRGSNGIAEDGTIAHPYSQSRYADDFPELQGTRYAWRPYSSVENFFDEGISSNTSISIDKSLGEYGAVSASYSYLSDEGIYPRTEDDERTNFVDKHSFSLGGRTTFENGLNLRVNFSYVDSDKRNPPLAAGAGSNPSGQSLIANLIYTPRSIDLIGLPWESPLDGSMVYYRRGSAIQNPNWTLHNSWDEETLRRFFGALDLSYSIFDWLGVNYRFGLDHYSQQQIRKINKGGSQTPDGFMESSDRINRIQDHVFNFNYNYAITDDITIDGIVGVNFRNEDYDYNAVESTNQFVFDLFNHGNFINHFGYSSVREENNIGAYATATLGYKDWVYLNLQARNDWTSTLEKDNNSVLYPSASVSFIPTEAFAGLQSTAINYLKVRFGYGTSAGYPPPYQTRNILATSTNVFVTQNGQILNTNSVSNRLGNPNLKHELHTELEFGLEGRFWNNRIGIDLSLYDKQSKDLIIDLDLDPSTGYTNTTVNTADVSNQGIELGLNLNPVRGKVNWDAQINFTFNDNDVKAIGEGIDQVQITGSFDGVAGWAIPGQPYGVLQGGAFRLIDGKPVVGVDGVPIGSTDIEIIGDPNADYYVSWINSISYAGFTLGWQWDYQKGGDLFSEFIGTMFARGNTKDTDFDRFLPVIIPNTVKEDGSPNDIQGYVGDLSFDAYFGVDQGTIFDMTHIRLREVSLSYEFPASLLEKTPFGSASIRLSGDNLFHNYPNTPKYVNYDGEVSSFGVGNGRGLEAITGLTTKRYGASLSFTF